MTILVTGARGRIAARVIADLAAAGLPVRAASGGTGQLALPAGVPTFQASLREPESLAPALRGVDAVFVYCEPTTADAVIARIQAAGVSRVVVLSALAAAWAEDDAQQPREQTPRGQQSREQQLHGGQPGAGRPGAGPVGAGSALIPAGDAARHPGARHPGATRHPGGHLTGGHLAGGWQPGAQTPGARQVGGQEPRGWQSDGEQVGGRSPGGQQLGGPRAGSPRAGTQLPEGQQSGGQQSAGRQSDDQQSGGWQAGGQQSGGWRAGGWQSGDQQSGGWRAGGWQAGDQQSGGWRAGERLGGEAVSGDGGGAVPPSVDPLARAHLVMERAVIRSGLAWTLVRPGPFATNTLRWAAGIRADGVVRVARPWAELAPAHERDIAAVAVRALTESGHDGQRYALTGPESISQARQVELIAAAIGRPIRLVELTDDQARAELAAWTTPSVADRLVAGLAATDGRPAAVLDTVARVLGRPATTFAEWAVEHRADFLPRNR